MRRIVTILIACLAFAAAKAETHYKPHISVGAHAGIAMSRVSFSPAVKQDWLKGKAAGISVRYAEERLVGILAELNYEQRGWAEHFEDSPLHYSRTIDYVSLPVMTHVYFGPPRFKCFFNLGPVFGLYLGDAIDANFDVSNPAASADWPEEPRQTAQLQMAISGKFDYGICGGFGCEFYFTPRHSGYIEARYYYGLGNIFPSAKADTFGASRCMSLSLTLGYSFRLK